MRTIGLVFFAISLPISTAGQNIAAGICLVAGILLYWPPRRDILPQTSLTPLFILLLALSAISIGLSLHIEKAISHILDFELWMIFVFYLPIILIRDKHHANRLLYIIFIATATAALFALYQYIHHIIWGEPGPPPGFRATGFFSFYLTFSEIICMIGLLVLGFALHEKSAKHKIIYFITTALIFSAILASKSRGPVLAFMFVSFLMSLTSKWSYTAGITIVFICLIALFSLDPTIQSRMTGMTEVNKVTDMATHQSTAIRIVYWKSALNMIATHPFFGVGYGIFGDCIQDFNTTDTLVGSSHAHSVYLNMAAESGLPALLIYLSIQMVLLIRFARYTLKHAQDSTAQRIGVSFLAIILVYGIMGITEEIWSDAEVFITFWFLMGIGFFLTQQDKNNYFMLREKKCIFPAT